MKIFSATTSAVLNELTIVEPMFAQNSMARSISELDIAIGKNSALMSVYSSDITKPKDYSLSFYSSDLI